MTSKNGFEEVWKRQPLWYRLIATVFTFKTLFEEFYLLGYEDGEKETLSKYEDWRGENERFESGDSNT